MCTVCGKQFHRSDYLKLHSFSHTNERPFNCPICGKGFKMNYNLKLHLKNHENSLENVNSLSSSNEEASLYNNGADSDQNSFSINLLSENYNKEIVNEDNLMHVNANEEKIHSIEKSNDLNSNEIVSFFIEDIDLGLRSQQRNSRSLSSVKLSLSNTIGLETNSISLTQSSQENGNLGIPLLDDHQINIAQ